MTIPSPADCLQYFRKQQTSVVDTIEQLVTIESPSDVKASVDRLATVLASRFSEISGKVKIHSAEKFGNHLQIDFGSPKSSRKSILLLGHMDTVYPIGTIAKMPFRVSNGRILGPGVLDMKGGIAIAMHVMEALQTWNDGKLRNPVTVFLVSDEEVGSASSRKITEKLARQSSAVFVLEPAAGLRGAVKTARKGVGEYTMRVQGVAAHAGLDPQKGHSAIVELSRQVLRLSEFANGHNGTTLNVGIARGGTRSNVVPAEAEAAIDVRITTKDAGQDLDNKLKSLQPFDLECSVTVKGGINRPPMERTPGVISLYAKASQVAKELDWDLEEASVGGGSDGNFTAALGIPTLDGLGAVGEGAHSTGEFILESELPRRAALLAGLIASL